MKEFFINLTRILEVNPKLYWSVIAGIAGCLILYFAEIVHIQNLLTDLDSADKVMQRAVLEPIAQRYQWARILVICLAVIWANWEYFKTKKALKLK
ncbi:hypothetical protein [Acinetobacter sp. ANC 4648]|uniref:hypothetical protein n=1 Tax=Acinetobacter sp. ANC 4648 TaxID=1977875 RepID=UPI000A35A5BC|nr:hypothetical protein [Acinetobacter sp. ANC 4648]OTG84676.1 hypothetical protein B9T27_00145 [Acinetobacter sp. ANC 4648]